MLPSWANEGLTDIFPVVITIVASAAIIALYHLLIVRHSNEKASRVGIQAGWIALTLIVVSAFILSLPINETLKGQLFSLIGIVLSAALALSSTTIVGNALAGLMLGQLKMGEFIQVNDYSGRLTERGLLHVEIQSEDRNLVVLPNLYLVTHPYNIIHTKGTIISSDLSLGYDVNRKLIESTLVNAAETAGLESPFVQIISLGDFSVTYRIAGVLKEVKHRMSARTELLKAVLDALHSKKIEIVSPTFMNTRAQKDDYQAIPDTRVALPETNQLLPIESIVFDKAEQAESLDSLKQKLAKARDGIDKLNTLLKSANEAEREALTHRINNLVAIKDRLKSELEKMEQELEK